MAVNRNKIAHPDFAHRMQLACDGNENIPPPNFGRLGWFKTALEEKFGDTATIETVRKWLAGESYPRRKALTHLANILQVDEAWLAVGKVPEFTEKQQKVRNASADGMVNVAAGFIAIGGGHPAFPKPDDARAIKNKIDLYAVIKGAQYAFNIVTGDKKGEDWIFNVPVEAVEETLVIGAMKTRDLCVEFVELDAEGLASVGKRRGAAIETKLQVEGHEWRKITSFSDRF